LFKILKFDKDTIRKFIIYISVMLFFSIATVVVIAMPTSDSKKEPKNTPLESSESPTISPK
jgi:hypothetical protein